MLQVKTNKGVLMVWESTKELPIDRFADFQAYAVQAIGIGSTMEDVNGHHLNLDIFLRNNKLPEAIQERHNMHYNFFLALAKVQIDHLMFACFVHSINGKEITDYSEEGLKRVCELLAQIKLNRGQLEDLLSDLKKKLMLRSN